ncbi:hypothetical protein PILCRDRAFT_12766 [Piloderma croceum F 1598]|uniref:Uncharacterized protein n=1 Tax=Piloderma croceum (strain F 1598) TaxID=765440 RepID=A0A0C3EVJ6_PILCF|nr:hypothetical protein PILCRDRAFT_12766 [Piloderma croceum F 1598]
MDSISNNFSHLSVGDLHASSEPSTPPALNRISLERDTFTNDDHNLLDEKIVNAFDMFRRYNEEPPLPWLLSNITMETRLTTLTTDEAEELLNREPSIATLKSAWRDNYHGKNHKLLFANINRIPRTQKAYSNQIAIVQSSGMGKSCMVHEQANLVFTIPFNLRESGDSKDLAFPIPDDAVRDYFVTRAYSTDPQTLKTNYLKFLGGVFTQVNTELDFC